MDKVSCVLCQRSEETKITGALSTKDQVTAHQNCLLFSSGIYCQYSPQSDDLFGFSVEDVRDEVKRGSKLMCNRCKKRGATAGCEVKRCKRSYHYPCAVKERAEIIEDADSGKYGLYCFKHCQKTQEDNSSSEAGPSKVSCLTCEKTEGNISLESLTNGVMILYCDKHAPSSRKRKTSSDSTAAELSVYSGDSNSSSSKKHFSSKRQLCFADEQEETPSKRKSEGWNRIISDDSSNSADADMAIFAPLESDLDGSANSVTDPQLNRKPTESTTGPTSGNQVEKESKDEDTDAESESLLSPVESNVESSASLSTPSASAAQLHVILVKAAEVIKRDGERSSPEQNPAHHPDQDTAGPSVPQHSSTGPAGSPPCTSSAISRAPSETICVSLLSTPTSPEPEPTIDSTSFWKSCNAAGCTQVIFTDFINEMNDISRRIQSDQASQEDYDLALTVMEASGKLAELVTKQQKELQRKQVELQKAAEAMKEVVSALRR